MRVLAILLVIASLFGCEDRYGTYITIRASSEDLKFDRLELYYGIGIGKKVPTTPKHAMPEPDDEKQLLVARAFSPSDEQMFDKLRDEYTVWIPDGGQNDAVGKYLLAIGYANGQRVAIGELFDFEVTDEREVRVYKLPLEPLLEQVAPVLEEWGRGTTKCLRVQRQRGADAPAVIAIVDPDDSDCDTFLDHAPDGATDCEPLLYCDGSGNGDCVGRTPCLHDDDACSIGSCSNKDGLSITCQDDTCVSDALCDACDLTESPEEILECALLDTRTHPANDFAITTHGDTRLCNDPTIVDITMPFPCTNPNVDAVSYFQQSAPFDISVTTGPMQNVCRFTIASTTDARFSGVPHLLVSVEIMPPRRTGFVLGLIGVGGSCPTSGEPEVGQYQPNLGTCPMPDF